MLGTAVDATDGNHGRILRINLPAHQCLQRTYNSARQHDWVFGCLRIGTVAANAFYFDIDGIDIRQREAR